METINKMEKSGTVSTAVPGLSPELAFILDKARLAPSADNLQPWKFVLRSPESVEVRLHENYISNYCDAGFAAPCISAGAVLENMRVAAAGKGLAMKVDAMPDDQDPLLTALVSFLPASGAVDSRHLAALEKRHTNRKFYKAKKMVSAETLSSLKKQIPSDSEARLHFIMREDSRYQELAEIIGQADQLRFEIPRLHKEFMEILRFKGPAEDGLTIASLDAGPSAGVMFPLIRSWERLVFLNKLGMSFSFNLYAKMQMLSSSGAGLITVPGKSLKDYLHGGEIMERVWHETALQNLAFQPMEGLPIFIISKEATNGKDLGPDQKKRIEELAEKFYSLFGITRDNGLIIMFRFGYAPPASSRSQRRPLESFVQGADCPAAT